MLTMREYFCLVLCDFPASALSFWDRLSQLIELCLVIAQLQRKMLPTHHTSRLAPDVTTSARDIFKRLKQPTLPVRQGKCRFCTARQVPRGEGTAQMDPFQTTGTTQPGQSRGRLFTLLSGKGPAANASSRNTSLHSLSCRRWFEPCAVVLWEAKEGQICNLALAGDDSWPRLGDHRLCHSLPEEAVLATPASWHQFSSWGHLPLWLRENWSLTNTFSCWNLMQANSFIQVTVWLHTFSHSAREHWEAKPAGEFSFASYSNCL